jgi:hypothetical protein
VYEVASREELDQLLAEEPYITGGVVAGTRVREWDPGKGSWAAAGTPLEAERSH